MLIPSLDPNTVIERAVMPLNPIPFSMGEDDFSTITLDRMGSVDQRGANAAKLSKWVGVTTLGATLSSLDAILTLRQTAPHADLASTTTTTMDMRIASTEPQALFSAKTGVVSPLEMVRSSKHYLITSATETVLINIALPFPPSAMGPARLRFWVRHLGDPVLKATTSLFATLNAPNEAVLSAQTSLTATPFNPGFSRFSSRSGLTADPHRGKLLADATSVSSMTGAMTLDQAERIAANLTASTQTGNGFNAHIRTRYLTISRCIIPQDYTPIMSSTQQPNIDTSVPPLVYDIAGSGWADIDLSPLMEDSQMLYSFVISTEDIPGFMLYYGDPGYRDREPFVGFGESSYPQDLGGPYIATIVDRREVAGHTYPVPVFEASESIRIAAAWNTAVAAMDDPSQHYTLEYDSNELAFKRKFTGPSGTFYYDGAITPVRLGGTIYYPMFSWDYLWVIDTR